MKRIIIIMCSIILVTVIVVTIFHLRNNKEKLAYMALEKGFGAMEEMIIKNCPEFIAEDSVKIAFNAAVLNIKSGKVDREKLKGFVFRYYSCMSDKMLDSLEVITLLDELEKLGE